MKLYFENCFSENILESSLFKINKNRFNSVQKNIPYEEKYLNKKKHFEHLLDLKFCTIKTRNIVADPNQYISNDNDNLNNNEFCVYFILRQWSKFENEYNKNKGENNSKKVKSYVVIGKHTHNNFKCFYEEFQVEIINYNVETTGFFIQIHVNKNQNKIFLLSSKECALIRNKLIKNNFVRAELLLQNKVLNISPKRKIIKAEWYNKSNNVIALLTYEKIASIKPYNCNFRAIIRLINTNSPISEEIKIIIPDSDILQNKINEDLNYLKSDNMEIKEKFVEKSDDDKNCSEFNSFHKNNDAIENTRESEYVEIIENNECKEGKNNPINNEVSNFNGNYFVDKYNENRCNMNYTNNVNTLKYVEKIENTSNSDHFNIENYNESNCNGHHYSNNDNYNVAINDSNNNTNNDNDYNDTKNSVNSDNINNNINVNNNNNNNNINVNNNNNNNINVNNNNNNNINVNNNNNINVNNNNNRNNTKIKEKIYHSQNSEYIETSDSSENCDISLKKKYISDEFDSILNYYNDDLTNNDFKEKFFSHSIDNKVKRSISKKNKYKNLVVDFCFGSISENIIWIETCLFLLFKNGLILIYSPIITRKCYISYYLLHELNEIKKRKDKCYEYKEDFLEYYDYFKNCSIIKYRSKYVCMNFKQKEEKIYYLPYVINCLKNSFYNSINLIYYNNLVLICICDKFGYISFLLLNYYITPFISMDSKNKNKNISSLEGKKEHFFNIFNNNENVILKKMNLEKIKHLINKENYEQYYNKLGNKYQINYILEKIDKQNIRKYKYKNKMDKYINKEKQLTTNDDKVAKPLNHIQDKKKSSFKEMFVPYSNETYSNNKKFIDEKHNGDVFLSCYEDLNEMVQNEMDFEINIEFYLLNILFYDSYYTGMSNVRSIVLCNNNLLCFNNNKIIILNLIWLKLFHVVFYLLYLKNFLLAKLIYDFCINNLYMKTSIFKSKINFYEFDYYNYLLLDYTKQLCHHNFAKLFKMEEKVLNDNYKEKNFNIYQSNLLYNVEYVLYPVTIEDEYTMLDNNIKSVYFIFTHYINLDCQRKEKLFMNESINYFTCAIYKKLFLIYDCFKLILSSNTDKIKRKDKKTEIQLIEKKNSNPFCILSKQTKLRNYIINSITLNDEEMENDIYKNMFSCYMKSLYRDYISELFKKNSIYYNRNLDIFNILNYSGTTKKNNVNNTICKINDKTYTNCTEKLFKTSSKKWYNYNNEINEYKNRKYEESNDSSNGGYEDNDNSGMDRINYEINSCKENTKDENMENESYKYNSKENYNIGEYTYMYNNKNETNKEFNGDDIIPSNLNYEFKDFTNKFPNENCDSSIQLLRDTFVILDKSIINDKFKDIKKDKNKLSKEIILKLKTLDNNQIDSNTIINDMKNYILTSDKEKYENVECIDLIKKLIKIKNDYIDVKDYYLKKNNININNSFNSKDQIASLENILKCYYFFLGLNSYYEKKFKKIKNKIIKIMTYKVINLIEVNSNFQNTIKSINEKKLSLKKNIYMCNENQKLIKKKFNLLKKRIILYNQLNNENVRNKQF
ncbi:conserved Plasmodium protein, unknown function [Plasmodium gallinaceum]|uniref:Uncharacterized protein n=1 Tax=Plasmodium gallinaceum TaxID=5849 RepID=A0A1J1GTW5_PLAGA|nr:conserved Plasmodium protein, unknown function [Plasmodium gallinaceum]CRG95895.1 conserved Plasmodium protein, unknown function [Plasmodium gallinaceum]